MASGFEMSKRNETGRRFGVEKREKWEDKRDLGGYFRLNASRVGKGQRHWSLAFLSTFVSVKRSQCISLNGTTVCGSKETF
ncbi:hypothetical protein TNIN_291471 [Trichonephila inaurata madagascariensis]|uniref:Uncharacterized protein n=1 Tax=Trichonephila inaurata madagascariensis TaxID=2747483 RepID=A0A8X6YHX3_9ARAC|nr:hypothetical protein TNIN_291471 [Trichonephila inaurata madagascariensis]